MWRDSCLQVGYIETNIIEIIYVIKRYMRAHLSFTTCTLGAGSPPSVVLVLEEMTNEHGSLDFRNPPPPLLSFSLFNLLSPVDISAFVSWFLFLHPTTFSWFFFRGKFDGRDAAVKRILPECFSFADREVWLSPLKNRFVDVYSCLLL